MRYFRQLLLLSLFVISSAFAAPPKTVPHVDLKKYMGKWYEIASFPNWFQKGCQCTTAQYSLQGKEVKVINQCYKGNPLKLSQAKGKAWAVDDNSNAKLKVQFFWPFKGDYWILHLTPGYQQVLIGSPNHKYLWILARQRHISNSVYQQLVGIAKQQGFNVSKLVRTNQDCTFSY